jgi:hypothetical protein
MFNLTITWAALNPLYWKYLKKFMFSKLDSYYSPLGHCSFYPHFLSPECCLDFIRDTYFKTQNPLNLVQTNKNKRGSHWKNKRAAHITNRQTVLQKSWGDKTRKCLLFIFSVELSKYVRKNGTHSPNSTKLLKPSGWNELMSSVLHFLFSILACFRCLNLTKSAINRNRMWTKSHAPCSFSWRDWGVGGGFSVEWHRKDEHLE